MFDGELMTCIICGAQERSDPRIESQWRALLVDDVLYYVCPGEFPPDEAEREDFKTAYQLIISKILLVQAEAAGSDTGELKQEFESIYQRYKIRLVQLRRDQQGKLQ